MIILFTSGIHAFAQQYMIENIKQEYGKIFHAASDEMGTSILIEKLPNDHFLSDFVRENDLPLNYFIVNASTFNTSLLNTQTDSIKLNLALINLLKADTIFNKYLFESLHYYWASKNKSIIGFQPLRKSIMNTDSLLRTAAGFFYLFYIDAEENFGVRMGMCGNAYSGGKTESFSKRINPNPLLEAFCYSTILTNYDNKKYNLGSEIKKSRKNLKAKKVILQESPSWNTLGIKCIA